MTDLNDLAARCEEGSGGEAVAYAKRLAVFLHAKHYAEVEQWRPLEGDLIGLLTQIDNMVSGLTRAPSPPAGGGEPVAEPEIHQRIRAFFVSNIGATRTECADALGVDRRTIWKHLKRMRGSLVHPISAGLRESAEELADLVDAIVEGEYTPDSFTTQPIRAALEAARTSPDAAQQRIAALEEALRKIASPTNPERLSGAHLTPEGRRELAFAMIDNFQSIARKALGGGHE